jgi:hypothetical protein
MELPMIEIVNGRFVQYAHVLLGHPEGYLQWRRVPWLDPWDCEHQETMCVGCVDGIDHEIELPDGIDA